MKLSAGVVLAAGRGVRFGTAKQYERLSGRTLVAVAVELVKHCCDPVVLVLPEGGTWEDSTVSQVVTGGATRIDSLKSALEVLPSGSEILVVHDCIRPLAQLQTLRNVIDAVAGGADAAIPVWQTPDVIKRLRPDGTLEQVGREGYVIAQGPIACRFDVLCRALAQAHVDVVEETHAIERVGGRVVAVAGDPWSHHVVDRKDLEYVRRLN